jgi:hypothetical protein
VYHQNHETHYVFARVYVPEEGIEQFFDAEVIEATDEYCVVRSGAVEQPVRNFTIPASCILQISVGSKK